ncbi:hypothetical protein D3C72_1639880 [compost metagenome]
MQALQCEFIAIELGAQGAVAQIHAIELRLDMHFVGRQASTPARIAQVAGQLHVCAQAARHAPSRRGEAGPDAQVRHLGLDGAAERGVGRDGCSQIVFAFELQRGL